MFPSKIGGKCPPRHQTPVKGWCQRSHGQAVLRVLGLFKDLNQMASVDIFKHLYYHQFLVDLSINK